MENVEHLKFLSEEQAVALSNQFSLPIYVYSEHAIKEQINKALSFPVNEGFGLTVRYAMKANPNRTILQIMLKNGVHIDASSEYEAQRAMLAGFPANFIQLTAQQLATDLSGLVRKGVQFNACSLRQLEAYGKQFPGTSVSVRFNPGMGSGSSFKTDVGGQTSSFGIWFEQIPDVLRLVADYNLKVTKVHTHIGSGSDPAVWERVAGVTLRVAEQFPHCTTVNLGGGYKVGRMADEKSTDMATIGAPVKTLFWDFFQRTNRKLHLEIEPGSFYVVNAGAILCLVDDIVSTGHNGYEFLKLNIGMDSITRPSLYGARHPIIIIPRDETRRLTPFHDRLTQNYVIVGHCCETGDMLTQSSGGELQTRAVHVASTGDLVVVEGAELAEVLIRETGEFQLIRKPQTLEQILTNEI